MRERILVFVLVVGAAALWRLWAAWHTPPLAGDRSSAAVPGGDRGPASATRDTPPTPVHGAGATSVRLLSSEERRRLGTQITAARQRARAQAAAAAGSGAVDLTEVVIPLERVATPAQRALQDSVSLLADCYPHPPTGGPPSAMVLMTMTSDPELGTVIDTSTITDGEGKPLLPAVDSCLRDRIDSLALPPLGPGGKLPLQYTFRFASEADAGAGGR